MLLMSIDEVRYARDWQRTQRIGAGAVAQQVPGDPDEFVAEADAARLIPPTGVSVRSMSRYRRAGLIAFFRIRGRIFYRIGDLQAFVSSMRTPAASAPVSDQTEFDRGDEHLELWRLLDGDI
jgi:hypothetical protein